jgi:hypothetical protein
MLDDISEMRCAQRLYAASADELLLSDLLEAVPLVSPTSICQTTCELGINTSYAGRTALLRAKDWWAIIRMNEVSKNKAD